MSYATKWQERAVNPQQFDALDRAWRKRLGFFAGLHFFRRTNVRFSYVLVSRHWPHKLCWDWSLGWDWAFRKNYYSLWCWRWRFSRPYVYIGIGIGNFTFHRQGYGHMPALGSDYSDAPQVAWKRQILQRE